MYEHRQMFGGIDIHIMYLFSDTDEVLFELFGDIFVMDCCPLIVNTELKY